MSFSCPAHGWQHQLKDCPSCQQFKASNNSFMGLGSIDRAYDTHDLILERDKLREENEKLKAVVNAAREYCRIIKLFGGYPEHTIHQALAELDKRKSVDSTKYQLARLNVPSGTTEEEFTKAIKEEMKRLLLTFVS